MDTARYRAASAMSATTASPPPTAAPTNAPVFDGASTWTTVGAAIPATGLGDGESVGPGVSVGVTEADARNDRLGVGVGVEEEDGLGVETGVGVGE